MRKLYPVSVSCEVLEVSASGYFNWLRRRESGHGGPARRHSDEALLAHIRAIHAEVKGEYGWPRMHKELLARGIRVGKDRVRKLMQQHGIKARTKRKFVVTTDCDQPEEGWQAHAPRRQVRGGLKVNRGAVEAAFRAGA